jgi:TATA-box binding protein (TBP) (component of TFIID and TFIIIB)
MEFEDLVPLLAADGKSKDEPVSFKKKYNKTNQRPSKLPFKEHHRRIHLARSMGRAEMADQLAATIPKRAQKSRAQTPLTGLARINQKNKKKAKIHEQTDEPYPMTPMNYVSKASARPRDISELKYNYMRAKHVPSRFPAASAAIPEPRCVISLYDSGEIGLAGNKSQNDAIVAGHLFNFHQAKRAGEEMTLANLQPVNITTSANVGVPIDLNRFYQEHRTHEDLSVAYEPTVIQAVQVRPLPKVSEHPNGAKSKKTSSRVFNVFATGRFCSVGHKSDAEIAEAAEFAQHITDWALQDYEKVKLEQKLKAENSSANAQPAVPSRVIRV